MRRDTPHDLYARYTALSMIGKGCYARQIAAVLRVNPSNVKRRIYVLEKQGFLRAGKRSAYRSWELTDKGKTFVEALRLLFDGARFEDYSFPVTFRPHHLIVKFQPCRDWVLKAERFLALGFHARYRGLNLHGWEVQRSGCSVFWTGKSLLVFVRPVVAGSLLQAEKQALDLARECARWFSGCTGIRLVDRLVKCREHIAMVGGATLVIPEGYSYRDDRLVIDASTGVVEVETVNTTLALDDMANIVGLLKRAANGEV